MLPHPDILNDFEHGKFVLSNLAAKRAKQLREGAPALVQIESNHPLTIALAEIAAGKIKAILQSPGQIGVESEMALLVDEHVSAELGMLLPALDETEVALVTVVGEEDHDPEADPDEVLTLADLGDDEEEAAEVVDHEEDTLSLSDIAEQEDIETETEEES